MGDCQPKVMVVDDDPGMLATLEGIIEDEGYDVVGAEDGYQAIALARDTPFALIFMDIKMPGINGVETHREIKKVSPGSVVVMMTGFSVEELGKSALEEGAYAVIYKPFSVDQIIEIVLADSIYFSDVDQLRDIGEVVRSQPDISSLRVFTPDGRVLVSETRADDQSDYPAGFVPDPFALSAIGSMETRLRFKGDSLEVASPILVGREQLGVVQFGFEGDALGAEIREIIVQHIWQGLILMAIAIALSYAVARYAAKPLQALTACANRIGLGDLGAPVPTRGTRETVELGSALEGMRIELRGLYSGLERQVAQRTKELAETNEELRREVAERKRGGGSPRRSPRRRPSRPLGPSRYSSPA